MSSHAAKRYTVARLKASRFVALVGARAFQASVWSASLSGERGSVSLATPRYVGSNFNATPFMQ